MSICDTTLPRAGQGYIRAGKQRGKEAEIDAKWWGDLPGEPDQNGPAGGKSIFGELRQLRTAAAAQTGVKVERR